MLGVQHEFECDEVEAACRKVPYEIRPRSQNVCMVRHRFASCIVFATFCYAVTLNQQRTPACAEIPIDRTCTEILVPPSSLGQVVKPMVLAIPTSRESDIEPVRKGYTVRQRQSDLSLLFRTGHL